MSQSLFLNKSILYASLIFVPISISIAWEMTASGVLINVHSFLYIMFKVSFAPFLLYLLSYKFDLPLSKGKLQICFVEIFKIYYLLFLFSCVFNMPDSHRACFALNLMDGILSCKDKLREQRLFSLESKDSWEIWERPFGI